MGRAAPAEVGYLLCSPASGGAGSLASLGLEKHCPPLPPGEPIVYSHPSPEPAIWLLLHVQPVTCLFFVLPGRPAPKTSPTALTQEGQGPPWAPRESPAKGMNVKLIVPLQDGGPRPRRVAPFAVVNLTRVRCVQAAISQASGSGPVQAGAGPQSEGPSRAGREGGQARARGEERLAFSGCLSSPPSLPAISWPLTDKWCWYPARACGFPRRGSVWVHSPNPGGRTHRFQAPHPTVPLPTVDTGAV